jgi:CP family cyanate transporter-like MFS transporter
MMPWLIFGLFASIWWLKMNRNKVELAEIEMSPHFHVRFFHNVDAWAITLFFGFQSMMAYGIATWLPSILLSKGYSLSEAGYAVSATGLMGSLFGTFIPYFAVKIKKFRALVIGAALLISTSFTALIFDHGWHLLIWLLLGSVGLAVSFQVSLLLTIFRGASPGETRSLSIMSQSIGYLMATFAPGMVGAIYDATGNWNEALALPIALGLVVAAVGVVAAREGTV